jgi:DNA modification methylase
MCARSWRNCRRIDPFAGAGTTGLVADRLGRDCTMIDLNTQYAEMALKRIRDDCPMFVEVAAE